MKDRGMVALAAGLSWLAAQPAFAQSQAQSVAVANANTVTADTSSTTSSEEARTLALAEALEIAYSHAPAVMAALARVEQARTQVFSSRTALLPSVSASASLGASASVGSLLVSGIPVSRESAALWIDTAVQVRWTFWDFGRTQRNVTAAERNVTVARESARVTQRQALANTANAYLVALSDVQLANTARETLAQREKQLASARGLVEAGARAPIEQTRAELAVQTAKIDLESALGTLEVDTALLAASLGLDPRTHIVLSDPPPVSASETAEAAMEQSSTRAEIVAARAQLDQARAQLDAARGGQLPSLSMSAGVNFRLTENLIPLSGGPLPSTQPNASLVLSVPLYDPTTIANIRNAESAVFAQVANLAQAEQQARADAVQGVLAVQSARRTLAMAEQTAQLAKANLDQAEGRYAAGASSMLELIDAQAADATSRVNVVRARLQLELARVRLAAATGDFRALGTRSQ